MRRILVLAGGLCFAGALYADTAAYTYNGAGRLASVVYPDGTVVSYAYDAAGNLTARTVTSGGGGNSAPKAKPGKKPATKRRAERGISDADHYRRDPLGRHDSRPQIGLLPHMVFGIAAPIRNRSFVPERSSH